MIYKDFQNLRLPMLGFGSMRLPLLPGGGDGDVDEAAVAEMVALAMERGANYFDTAYGYHNGNSERVMGRALSRYPRESWLLASKFPGYDVSNIRPDRVEAIFEEQLEKCGVDYFDFYLFHNVYERNVGPYLDPANRVLSVYPPIHIEDRHKQTILKYTYDLSRALGVVGLVNIQFVIYDDQVYVIEVNPRSSRTIPYISKVTGVPIIDLATRVMLGQKLRDLGYGTGIYREADYYAVKMPVFSFEKLTDVDTGLGPEMRSTGECLGLAESFPQALLKAFKGAGMKAPKKGGRIIVTVKDEDKDEMIGIARGFYDMGIELLATSGTCKALNEAGIPARWVARVSEAHPNILDMIASGTVDLVINTPTRGRRHDTDGFKIRRSTVEHSVACITAIDTARAMLTVRTQGRAAELRPIDITEI